MSTVSRYGIIPNDLRIHAMTLNIGQGLADRFNTPDAIRFILDGERLIEAQVSDFLVVPLKPTPAPPGLTLPVLSAVPSPPVAPPFPPQNITQSSYAPEVSVTPYGMKWNFPVDFIQSVIFMAIAEMLRSEYFEVEPNKTEYAEMAEARSMSYVYLFRTRPTVLVGAGRRRTSNSHVPPNIAPRGNINVGPPGRG